MQLGWYRIEATRIMVDVVQRRWPRSKKRRIRKKWLKRYGTIEVPREDAVLLPRERLILVAPELAGRLQAEMERITRDKVLCMPPEVIR